MFMSQSETILCYRQHWYENRYPTGKRQLHGTAMAAFQQHIHGKTHPIMQIQRKSKRRKTDVLLYEDLTIPVPTKEHIENPNYLNIIAQAVLQQ